MKILGLLGVWLWLGTLLANASGADAAHFAVVLCDDWSAHAVSAADSATTKADDDGQGFAGLAPDLALPVSSDLSVPRIAGEEVAPRGAGTQALRRLRVAWRLGQGPPPPAAC